MQPPPQCKQRSQSGNTHADCLNSLVASARDRGQCVCSLRCPHSVHAYTHTHQPRHLHAGRQEQFGFKVMILVSACAWCWTDFACMHTCVDMHMVLHAHAWRMHPSGRRMHMHASTRVLLATNVSTLCPSSLAAAAEAVHLMHMSRWLHTVCTCMEYVRWYRLCMVA